MRILLVLIAAAVILAAVSVGFDRRRMAQSARALGLDAPGVRTADCPGPMFRFAVKPEAGMAYLFFGAKTAPLGIPLADIAGCEFIDGGSRPQGMGGFLVGEAAADALSGRSRGSVLRILRRSPDSPPAEFRLVKSTYHEDFRIFAREVEKLLAEYTE